ncbi:hypothetical protein ACJX0J_009355 [Zea mays]
MHAINILHGLMVFSQQDVIMQIFKNKLVGDKYINHPIMLTHVEGNQIIIISAGGLADAAIDKPIKKETLLAFITTALYFSIPASNNLLQKRLKKIIQISFTQNTIFYTAVLSLHKTLFEVY